MAERSIGNREAVSSILTVGSGGTTADGRLTTVVSHRSAVHPYGEASSDHHGDETRPLCGVALEGACAQARPDQAEI